MKHNQSNSQKNESYESVLFNEAKNMQCNLSNSWTNHFMSRFFLVNQNQIKKALSM